MRTTAVVRAAALAATVGFAGLAVFQVLLAAGAPLGAAAWGGSAEDQLPTGLRIGSALAVVVYAVAAGVILRRGGVPVRWVSDAVARTGSWVLVVLLTLGAFANVMSESPWERFLLGPLTLVLAALCLVVARGHGGAVPDAGGSSRAAAT